MRRPTSDTPLSPATLCASGAQAPRARRPRSLTAVPATVWALRELRELDLRDNCLGSGGAASGSGSRSGPPAGGGPLFFPTDGTAAAEAVPRLERLDLRGNRGGVVWVPETLRRRLGVGLLTDPE